MNIHVVGAGGHAKVITALIEAAGHVCAAVYDADPAKVGTTILGHEVRALSSLPAEADVVIAIGNNQTRQRVASELGGRHFTALVHPFSWVAPSARVEAGAVVFAGAVIQPDSVVGAHAIVNTSASIDHDCRVGPFAHIAPGSHLAGNVTVGDGAFLGVGVSVIPGKKIGAWSTVGAGAVVVADVPARVVVMGVPAKAKE